MTNNNSDSIELNTAEWSLIVYACGTLAGLVSKYGRTDLESLAARMLELCNRKNEVQK